MTWRREHSRTNRFGTTFHVCGHTFNMGERGRGVGYNLKKSAGEVYVNGTLVFNIRCPGCAKPVFFYQNEHGSRVFFERLGKPWPRHDCPNWQRRFELQPVEIRGQILHPGEVSASHAGNALKFEEVSKPQGLGKKARQAIHRAKQLREEAKKQKKAEQRRLAKLDEMRKAWEAEGKPINGRLQAAQFEIERRRRITIKKGDKGL